MLILRMGSSRTHMCVWLPKSTNLDKTWAISERSSPFLNVTGSDGAPGRESKWKPWAYSAIIWLGLGKQNMVGFSLARAFGFYLIPFYLIQNCGYQVFLTMRPGTIIKSISSKLIRGCLKVGRVKFVNWNSQNHKNWELILSFLQALKWTKC
jgi:hypothetical protein